MLSGALFTMNEINGEPIESFGSNNDIDVDAEIVEQESKPSSPIVRFSPECSAISVLPRDIWTRIGVYLRVIDIYYLLLTGNSPLRQCIQEGVHSLGDHPSTHNFQTILKPNWYLQFKNLRTLILQGRYLYDPHVITILNHTTELRKLYIYGFRHISNATFMALPNQLETLSLDFNNENFCTRFPREEELSVHLNHSFMSFIPSTLKCLCIRGFDASCVLFSHNNYQLCTHIQKLELNHPTGGVARDNISYIHWTALTSVEQSLQWSSEHLLSALQFKMNTLLYLSCEITDFSVNLCHLPKSLVAL
jgi:hypothetical protein